MFFSALSGRPAAFVFSLVALLDILEGCTRAPAVVKKKKEKIKIKKKDKKKDKHKMIMGAQEMTY